MEWRTARLIVKVVMNVFFDILSAPAARTKGESGMGGGRMAGRATARMAWRSIQSRTRLKMRGGCVSRGRPCLPIGRPGS